MTLLEILILLVVAGVCGAVGQAIAGGSRGGCLAHLGALSFIAIAAAPKHDDETVAGIRAQGVERFRQRIGRMGIVDEDRHHAPRHACKLEPAPRDPERCKHRQRCFRAGAGCHDKPGRHERI